MGVYDFEVLKDGAVIAAEQTVALPGHPCRLAEDR